MHPRLFCILRAPILFSQAMHWGYNAATIPKTWDSTLFFYIILIIIYGYQYFVVRAGNFCTLNAYYLIKFRFIVGYKKPLNESTRSPFVIETRPLAALPHKCRMQEHTAPGDQ